MRTILLASMIACGSDIAIITTEKRPIDTSVSTVDETGEPTSQQEEETSSEPASEMTDLTIGFAEISLTQIACPACMGVSSEFDISANLKLHQPTSGGYNDMLVPVGTCVTQELGSYVSSTPLAISGTASFNSIQLYPSGQAEWTASNLQEFQIPRREPITVVTEAGIIPNAFETLEGFDDIQPWELRYVDPSYAFAAVVSKQGTTFTWYPVITGSQFEVMVVVYSPDGSQILGLVSCMENDVGYITVPGSYFAPYPTWALAAVYLTRHRTDRQPAFEFNGYLESHQTWTVLGTAHIE
ncbi:MAG: hypothetical protein CBB97_07300 [Candidatus Endolissoclinum sp. TMED37]|nr:MAG: hypothetical protein CBB97_07300 [Candidatus Endolissoclinum sp. TMED37]